jgi:hypothetical protein
MAESTPPGNGSVVRAAGTRQALPLVALLALAAALACAASLAALRPGLPGRLRASLVAVAGPLAPDAEGAALATRGDVSDTSPLERSVARLVPLAVVDDTRDASSATSTTSRSAVRRILPPT